MTIDDDDDDNSLQFHFISFLISILIYFLSRQIDRKSLESKKSTARAMRSRQAVLFWSIVCQQKHRFVQGG